MIAFTEVMIDTVVGLLCQAAVAAASLTLRSHLVPDDGSGFGMLLIDC